MCRFVEDKNQEIMQIKKHYITYLYNTEGLSAKSYDRISNRLSFYKNSEIIITDHGNSIGVDFKNGSIELFKKFEI